MIEDHKHELMVDNLNIRQRKDKAETLRPNFGWLSSRTSCAHLQSQSNCVALHQDCRCRSTLSLASWLLMFDETVAADTFHANTPAHDDGIVGHGGTTMLQLHVGKMSQSAEGFLMQSKSQMPGALEDSMRKVKAPNALFSDNAKVQIAAQVQNILCHHSIKRINNVSRTTSTRTMRNNASKKSRT
jgi:hypothetical protein